MGSQMGCWGTPKRAKGSQWGRQWETNMPKRCPRRNQTTGGIWNLCFLVPRKALTGAKRAARGGSYTKRVYVLEPPPGDFIIVFAGPLHPLSSLLATPNVCSAKRRSKEENFQLRWGCWCRLCAHDTRKYAKWHFDRYWNHLLMRVRYLSRLRARPCRSSKNVFTTMFNVSPHQPIPFFNTVIVLFWYDFFCLNLFLMISSIDSLLQ